MSSLTISRGFSEFERPLVARLFWQAFAGKLGPIMRPEEQALAFLETVLDPAFAIAARDKDGTLLGIAGFKTTEGALVGGSFSDLTRHYGWLGTLWRLPLLALTERKLTATELLMDGIFVAAEARGRGAGSALLEAVKEEARSRDLSHVRLDVIDTNPRARALYERRGFVAGKTEDIGPFRHLFGFAKSTTMICDVTT